MAMVMCCVKYSWLLRSVFVVQEVVFTVMCETRYAMLRSAAGLERIKLCAEQVYSCRSAVLFTRSLEFWSVVGYVSVLQLVQMVRCAFSALKLSQGSCVDECCVLVRQCALT